MGQTPSNPTIATPSITRYSPKYHVIETKQDPHYGEVKIIVEDETNERQILKEISFNSQAAFDKELDFFTQRVQVSDPNIAGILGFSSENDNNVSPHLFTIKIFIELLGKDLQQELQERIQANKPFSESELLFICEGIISALYHLERQGFSHGDIRPFNIFASPKGYKLFDPSLSSQRNHNALIKVIKDDLQAFLSPELLAQVPENDQEIKCSKFKADVFSLGVTILSLASLTHGEDLYNYETGAINNKLLQERLNVVKNRYSMFTHDLIKDMLAEKETKRPNFKALHTKLLPYQDNIRQKIDLPFFKNKQNLGKGKEKFPGKTESTNLAKEGEVPRDPISGHQVEYTRKPTGSEPEEPIKPGGIIIDPEDTLPSKRGELYKGVSKNNEEYYYQYLHPKAGVINVVVENEANREEEKPLKSKVEKPEQIEGPVREFDYQKTRSLDKENVKMGGSYKGSEDILLTKEEKDKLEKEQQRNQREVVRTGSILIDPEDVLPSMRGSIQTDSRTGATYANLKSDAQIREEQRGIVHASGPQEMEKRSGLASTKREPIRTGSILINPEDVLPSMTESIQIDPRTGATYANLKSDTQIREEQRGIVHASGPQEMEKRSGMGQTKREPMRTGSILIDPEDVLPSMTESIRIDPRTGATYANLKSDAQIREEQRGIVHASGPQEVEKRCGMAQTKREPIRTGSILIDPEDVLPSMRIDVHRDPRTGETYANLKSDTRIREEQGGIVHARESAEREQIKSSSSRNIDTSKTISRQFVYELTRETPYEDPIKTGGIIIRKEDALSYMKDNIRTDPRSGETYAMLKPWTQIKEEQAQESREEEKVAERALEIRSEVKPVQEIDKKAPRMICRSFNLERARTIQEEDPIKTGGIVIDLEDALPMHRSEIRTDPRSRLSFASLKPWSQIQKEQNGIIHQGPLSKAREQQEKPKSSKRKRDSVIEPERVITLEAAGERVRENSQCEILHGSNKPRPELTKKREFDFVYTRPVQAEYIRKGQPTRFIEPENMLSWVKAEPEVQIPGETQESEPRHHREPLKTGSILIRREDVLPSEVDELHTDPRTGETYANLKSDFEIREHQGGIVHASGLQEVEKRSGMAPTKREPIRTGSILIDPEDVLPSMTESIQIDSRTGVTYANLKSDAQIRKQQGGIVYAPPETIERENQMIDIVRDPRVSEDKKSLYSSVRFQSSRNFCYEYEPLINRSQEEPIKTGGIVINPYDALPAHRESVLKDSHSRVTYVALKPWVQIQKEQNGVVHSSSVHHKASDDVLMKESKRVHHRRNENMILQDKENISSVANFKKSNHAQGEFSKSYSIPLGEVELDGQNVDSDKGFFMKQAEDRTKWAHLNDKVDTMLRKSRIILGESDLNATPNIS